MTLLYLDFDGCLHTDDVFVDKDVGVYVQRGSLFEHAAALEAALAAFKRVRIVLSSSWVPTYGYAATRARLPKGLGQRVIGSTHHRQHTPDWKSLSRFEQIATDAARRGQGAYWVAVDDDAEGWPDAMRNRLVCPHGRVGLQAADLARLVQLLVERDR
jgi:hypothetical protein